MATVLAKLREFFFPERGVLQPQPYAIVAAVGIAVGLTLALSDLAQRLEWALYDRYVSIATRDAAPAPGIVVVAIDEPSFAETGMQWPWPRSLHARLVEELARGGARSVVLDLLFDVPSDPGEDAALAAAVRRVPVVLASDLAAIVDRAYEVTQWADPIPPLADAAAARGAARITYDPDGVLRRTPLLIEGRPTLALAAARTARDFDDPPDLETARLIHFNGPPRRGILTVSYYQALDRAASLPSDIFRDKVVLVGRALMASTIDELPDHFATPVALRMAGVEVHANILDMLLRRRLITDPFGGVVALGWMLSAVGCAAAVVFYRTGALTGIVALAGMALVLPAAGYVALGRHDLRLPLVGPVITLAVVYASAAAYRFALVTRERRLIKRAFQHYVAPAIVEQMLSDPSRLRLGGEQYDDVTVMFTDLEGFTTMAERLSPGELRAHLSEYFSAMMDLLLAERATLDKFIGDAIMVYFGCPVRDPRHASQACRAALAMQQRMVELNARWTAAGLAALRMRVGINTGPVVAGNMGTRRIFNFTILGDCVNLASRLEGVNKQYGTLTIIGDDTRARIGGAFECRELDWIRVKGKERPTPIHELAAVAGDLPSERRELFARFRVGLEHYRRSQWAAASAEFRAALALDPQDGPSRVFLDRSARYAQVPPPPDWDGVHVMTMK